MDGGDGKLSEGVEPEEVHVVREQVLAQLCDFCKQTDVVQIAAQATVAAMQAAQGQSATPPKLPQLQLPEF